MLQEVDLKDLMQVIPELKQMMPSSGISMRRVSDCLQIEGKSDDCSHKNQWQRLLLLTPSFPSLNPETDAAKYELLIEEEMDAVRLMRKEEGIVLDPHFDYRHPSLNLSIEEADILTRVRPATV